MKKCFDHHRAITQFPNWVINDARILFKDFCPSVIATKEIVYSNKEDFKKYKGKKVLILGGGPSTLKINLEKQNYDYLWSCNHFFLSSALQNVKIDLAMLMAEVDPTREELIAYREKYKPYLGFEVHDKWFSNKFDNYDKYFFMHSRFYSRLGVGVRMILFAAALGAKQVSFSGLDGYKPIYDGNHAFQPGKNTLPSSFSEREYAEQYDYFWKYCQETFSETKFINLGEGHDLHKGII